MLVLHVFDHTIPLHSGYTFRSLAILRQQHRLGIETMHVSSSKQLNQTKATENVDGLDFYRTFPTALAKLPVLNQWDVIFTLVRRIEEIIKQRRPDVLHAHSPSLNGIAASIAGKKYKIPVVYEMRASWEDAAVSHGTCKEGSLRYKVGQWLEKYALNRASHVTTICHGLSEHIQQWGISQDKVTIIPNAVDPDKFTAQGVKNESLLSQLALEGKTILGFLGSFYRYEGLHLLIAAMPEIVKHRPNAHLLLVGGGPEEGNLKQQIQHLSLQAYVTFAGRVSHQEVNQYYSLIDLFVYPRESIRLTEIVTPLKPLEAMAQHGLVVASDIGGHREMITHNSTGILFKANDVNAISQSIIDLVGHPERWLEIKCAGNQYVNQERTWQRSVAPIKDVYQSIV
mgnify:CR=1 FL=1